MVLIQQAVDLTELHVFFVLGVICIFSLKLDHFPSVLCPIVGSRNLFYSVKDTFLLYTGNPQLITIIKARITFLYDKLVIKKVIR